MKRLLLVLPCLAALVMAGCQKTTARGLVVDQNGQGIDGIRIVIGNSTAVTWGGGGFTLPSLDAGTYEVQGRGGKEAMYLVSPKQVTVVSGKENDLGVFTAYQLDGIGVVAQSLSTAESLALKACALPSGGRITRAALGSGRSISRAATAEFLANNVSFIELCWQPPIETWITRYEVHYLGHDGTMDELVWRSEVPQAEDPAFDQANPCAYLDLGNELAGKVVSPGTYRFRVIAKGETQSKALPDITVSIGLMLAAFPSGLAFGQNQLSWNGVEGAHSYRISIYDEAQSSLLYFSPVLADTSLAVPAGLDTGTYYRLWLDALAVDDDGWVCEITRGISGFIR